MQINIWLIFALSYFHNIAADTTPAPNYNVLCPDQFEDLNPDSNFCYMVGSVANISWGDADSTCFRYDSRLASIHDSEENFMIEQALLRIKTDAWIGLQQDVQGEWKWCDDSPYEYNNWNHTNDNSSQLSSSDLILNCSMIDSTSGGWTNSPCEKLLNGFVCKIKKENCDYLGSQNQLAVDQGIDLATSKVGSKQECEKLCDVTRGCNSFSYTAPPTNVTSEMINCYLKDKRISIFDEMKYNKTWTTYYRACESSSNGTTNGNDIASTTPIPDPEIDEKDRLCPTGYFYSGDDTPSSNNALEGYWPVDESPKYSCYKVIPNVFGINDGLQKCYTSTIADKMEARVVIFEDSQEVERVFKHIFKQQEGENVNNVTLLTSAMYFEDVKKWLYLGTNYTVHESFDIFERNDSTKQCLVVEGIAKSKYDSDTKFEFAWKQVECNKPQQTILCEIRVDTVTYAWIPNWMAVVLIILTITSLFVLCIGGMCITSSQPSRRASSQQNCGPMNDLPPKYSDVIVTQESTFNKYKNKGRELLAKIYIVKE